MLAHEFGVGSEQVASHFLELDQAFEKLVGYHGGLSSQEVYVPLILVD